MLIRTLSAGLALAVTVGLTGCNMCHHDRTCATPGVVGCAPVLPPPPGPAPCCGGNPGAPPPPVPAGPPVQSFSVPVTPAPPPVVNGGVRYYH